jgi:dTDP-4-dehydrorhamnose reductase
MKQKHVIIGGGNLGLDLMAYGMSRQDADFKLFTASKGFRYPTSIDPILYERPDHVWVTAGAGSIEDAKKDFTPYVDLHIRLVMELAQAQPASPFVLHTFSTNYVVNPEASLYAFSKHCMENLLSILNRTHPTNVYRVESLYGFHKPLRCFPYKLIKNNPLPGEITLPSNQVTPTPTAWVAKMLLSNLKVLSESSGVYNLTPLGSLSVMEWGKMILGSSYCIGTKGWNKSRPAVSKLGCDIPGAEDEDWRDLWEQYWMNSHKSVQRRLDVQLRR